MEKVYPSDLTDQQWNLIKPHIPNAKEGGRLRTTDMRQVVNAIFYQFRTGCQWRYLPNDFPPRSTVYGYFAQWRDDGTLDDLLRILREAVRVKAGRNSAPSAGIIDSQSVKTAGPSESVCYDGGKKIKGRKRHICVDVMGLLLCVIVHSAGIQERAGERMLMLKLMAACQGIKIIWADGGYSGNPLKTWVKQFFDVIWEVVKCPRKVFKIVKFRWIVERTFGWMHHQRRLSKDYEYSIASAEGWIKVAAIHTMMRRLCPG
jgi:putative transposase